MLSQRDLLNVLTKKPQEHHVPRDLVTKQQGHLYLHIYMVSCSFLVK